MKGGRPTIGFQETFKALSDPTRREILRLLRDRAKTAGEIGSHFDMTGATISHHLAVLREAGKAMVSLWMLCCMRSSTRAAVS